MTTAWKRAAAQPWWRSTALAMMVVAATLAGCGGGGDGTTSDPVTYPVSVSVSGNGTVNSASGIDCGATCSTSIPTNTEITLTATSAVGHVFQAWGGACSSTSGTTCTLTVSRDTAVTASFVADGGGGGGGGGGGETRFDLNVAVAGNGSVTSQVGGINCGATCSASFLSGTSVTLTASPAQGQVLQAWGGACSGTAAACTVTMNAAQTVNATFAAAPAASLAWGTATLLENSNDFNVSLSGSGVLSAIDDSGHALVLWSQSDGTPDGNTRKVFSRRYTAGQTWGAAVAVPGLESNVGLVTGQLLMDAAGNATWVRHDFQTRRYTATGGWSATAFAPTGSIGELVDAKLDGSGNLHILSSGNGEVRYSRLNAGSSTWSAWTTVSFNGNGTGGAQLALGATSDSAVAIWRERNAGDNNDSMMANRMVGGAWQTPVRIEEVLTDVSSSTTPRIASDASGNAIAAWHQGDSIYVNRFNAANGTWGTATEVDAGLVSSTFNAHIVAAMAADGRAVVGWIRGLFSLAAMSYAPGTGFSAPAVVAPYSVGHTLSINRDGRALMVYRGVTQWPNPTDGTQNVYAQELPWGGAWSARTSLEANAGDALDRPMPCATNAAGQAVCAWAQNDLANNNVRNSLWANLLR